jgi:hypothetical protein
MLTPNTTGLLLSKSIGSHLARTGSAIRCRVEKVNGQLVHLRELEAERSFMRSGGLTILFLAEVPDRWCAEGSPDYDRALGIHSAYRTSVQEEATTLLKRGATLNPDFMPVQLALPM